MRKASSPKYGRVFQICMYAYLYTHDHDYGAVFISFIIALQGVGFKQRTAFIIIQNIPLFEETKTPPWSIWWKNNDHLDTPRG